MIRPDGAENKFVEACIRFSLKVIYHRTKKNAEITSSGLSIVIVGDNDFYSQRSQVLPEKFVNMATLMQKKKINTKRYIHIA